MNLDFNPPRKTMARPRRTKRRIPLLILLLAVAAAVFFQLHHQTIPTTEARTNPTELKTAPPPIKEIQREIIEGSIHPGDTITGLLGEYFTPQEIHDLASESRQIFPLSGICAGQPYKLCLQDGSFESFEYDINRDDQLIIRKAKEGLDISRIPIPYTVGTELVRGTITSSLFEAIAEIEENAKLADALTHIFAWDVDFLRDIRQGDSFQALVEKRFRDGKPAGYGKILAAEFTNKGESYQAVLFKDGDRRPDYYDPQGKSLRKAFLKAPLSYTRISSGYTKKRLHPVLNVWRPHLAIDYAAPTGTPIKAVADGTIIKKGYDKCNGNLIRIRHPNGYETTYIHMSRFAKDMKKGGKVRQGQVIGYVGSTGLATGPHLDFRVFKNGKPINPLKIESSPASPVSKEHLAEFKAVASQLMAKLDDQNIPQSQIAGGLQNSSSAETF